MYIRPKYLLFNIFFLYFWSLKLFFFHEAHAKINLEYNIDFESATCNICKYKKCKSSFFMNNKKT